MRTELSVTKSRTIKLTGQLSLIALLAGLGSACSMIPREPIFTGSTSNQQAIMSGSAGQASSPAGYGAYAGQSGGVQSNDLPPPAGVSAPAYASAPAPYSPPKPYAAPGMQAPVGQVASLAPESRSAPERTRGAPPSTLGEQAGKISGSTYVVQSGDTMYNIARRSGISVDALVAANGGSTTAKLGQKVVIPGGNAPAQQQPAVQVASLTPQAAAPATGLQTLAVPAGAAPPAPAPAMAEVPPPVPAPAAAPAAAPQQVALAPATAAAGAAAPAAPQPEAAAASGFRWPVRGKVIAGFGKKADGERNDGINLAVPEGTPVKAAEDGTVIYAGNELKSYGNLVLVRHSNGWVSAYAHNSELKVKRGQQVRRGEVVSVSGMSGGVTTPQVHFELRKDATPVDPLQHLTES
jgi:murein DD-endopeptidase MepM/ murein hydrolase activator NlpD